VTRLDSGAARDYMGAPLPDPGTPWREVSYSVIDFETTGLDPSTDEIISFAAFTVSEGKVSLHDSRYALVRPTRMPDADSIRIHGLREVDLADAPPLSARIDSLLEALTGRVLVAHVAEIETGFLSAALGAHGLNFRNPMVDTAALAVELSRLRRRSPPVDRDEAPGGIAISSPGLGELARSLGLPVHRPHHADGDALTTAQVFLALATHLEAFHPVTLGALVRISRPRSERVTLRSLLGRSGIERFRG
jgi:DNA polymerase III subunit epsilon